MSAPFDPQPTLQGDLLELAPGDHTIALRDIAGSCAVDGPDPRTVPVSLGAVSELSFSIVCGSAP